MMDESKISAQVVAGRAATPPATPATTGKKRKASSPLVDARAPRLQAAATAFRGVISLAEKLVSRTTTKGKSPAITSLVGQLWNAIEDYREIRYDLDIEFRALKDTTVADPPKKVATAEASTDTMLTPHWWTASEEKTEKMPLADLDRPRARTRRSRGPVLPPLAPTRSVATYASVAGGPGSPDPSDDDTENIHTDEWRTQRRTRRRPAPRIAENPKPAKPPAVLVKVTKEETFEKTLKTVREAVNPASIGVDVKKLSRTQDGHLLVELSGGPKAAAGAAALSKAVQDGASGLAGRVFQLGTALEVEVVDLDPGVEREEVQAALEAAVTAFDNEDSESLRAQVAVTGFWQVRSGTKIASAKIPRAAAKLASLKVGWTVAKVRPRRPEPVRCYRCHGFGHSSTNCTGPDLTGKCRRCGGAGHFEKSCTENAKCVACDRLGRVYEPHRTGSGNCLARQGCLTKSAAGPSARSW